MFVPLTESLAVAGQLAPNDVPAVVAAGYSTLVNNRPDHEEPGQPACAEMRAAATAAGLRYEAIPVDHGLGREQVAAMAAVLAAAPGPVLAYCRSGTRSASLWALAAAARGGDADAIIAACARGRYDVSGLRTALVALGREAEQAGAGEAAA